MKEAVIKERTLKVKNQTNTLQKVTIICDILFLIASFSVLLCNVIVSYILYRIQDKEGSGKWKIVLLVFLFITGGHVNSLLGLGNANLFCTFLPKDKASKKQKASEDQVTYDSSKAKQKATKDEKKESRSKKADAKKDVDLWLNHFAYQAVNRFIMEADACGCDFLQVDTSGKVTGYGEKDGELVQMYEDTMDRLPDAEFFPYICSKFEHVWKEISTDYSDEKFVVQWK